MDRNIRGLNDQFAGLRLSSESSGKDDLLHSRKWKPGEVQGRVRSWTGNGGHASLSFTVASYNILSQSMLEEHYDLYENVDARWLEWNHRKQKLLHELNFYQPDIICLQEVESDHYEGFFRPELSRRGYDGVYKQRTNGKVDGCATFYKRDKFVCEKSVPIEYNWPGLGIDRDNVALLVLLRAQNPSLYSGKLCVANTHLLYNPRRGDIKLAQLMLLLAKIDEVAQIAHVYGDQSHHPVILCGDFNLIPNSDLDLFLCRGTLQFDGGLFQHELSGQQQDQDNGYNMRYFPMQDNFLGQQNIITQDCRFVDVLRRRGVRCSPEIFGHVTHNLNLVSTFAHYCQTGGNRLVPEATSAHNGGPVNVDYILYSVAGKRNCFRNGRLQTSDVREGKLSLIQVLELPTDLQFRQFGSLPTRNTSSDHLILLVEFCLHN